MHPSVKPPSHVVDPIGMNVRGLFVSSPDRYPHRLIDCRPGSCVVSDGAHAHEGCREGSHVDFGEAGGSSLVVGGVGAGEVRKGGVCSQQTDGRQSRQQSQPKPTVAALTDIPDAGEALELLAVHRCGDSAAAHPRIHADCRERTMSARTAWQKPEDKSCPESDGVSGDALPPCQLLAFPPRNGKLLAPDEPPK